LASVVAPHMGTNNRAEEPFAFNARELFRNKIIGQKCTATVEYEHNTRKFVTLNVGGECINLAVVASGFAKVLDKGLAQGNATYDQMK